MAEKTFQEMTCNLSRGKVRREKLDGRDYLVAPCVLITHGVHAGNNGPIYYPDTQLSDMPSRWDHKPAVVYHPKKNGKFSTACDPTVLEKSGVGMMMATGFDDKLRTEVWFDEKKTRKVDKRVIEALESETMMEVSIGLFMDVEMAEGEFEGKPYVGIARNFAPDHIAILPDKIGACPIKAGGGLLQTNQAKEISVDKKTYIDYLITVNDSGWAESDRSVLEGFDENKLKAMHDFAKKAETPPPVPVVNQTPAPVAPAVVVPVTQPVQATTPPVTPRVISVNELPPELQELVAVGQQAKTELVKSIMAVNGNTFTEQFLSGQTSEVLRGMASLANVQQATRSNYFGAATVPPMTANHAPEPEVVPLGCATMDFSK